MVSGVLCFDYERMLLQELKVKKKKKGGEGLREEGMVIFLELRPPR